MLPLDELGKPHAKPKKPEKWRGGRGANGERLLGCVRFLLGCGTCYKIRLWVKLAICVNKGETAEVCALIG